MNFPNVQASSETIRTWTFDKVSVCPPKVTLDSTGRAKLGGLGFDTYDPADIREYAQFLIFVADIMDDEMTPERIEIIRQESEGDADEIDD